MRHGLQCCDIAGYHQESRLESAERIDDDYGSVIEKINISMQKTKITSLQEP